jgi:hypothetical protein
MMSTLRSLIRVYGAIDQMVGVDPETQVDVAARYLPEFADPDGGPGWFDEIVELASARAKEGVTEVSFGTLDDAFGELTALEADLSLSEIGRLVFAVAMIVRLDVDSRVTSREELVSLLVPATPDADFDTASKLLELVASDEIFPDRSEWRSMLQVAADQGLLNVALLGVSPPCTETYVSYGGDLVTHLATYFRSDSVTIDDVKAVLDPLNWDDCCKFFCSMSPLAADNHGWRQVLEEVSADCPSWSLKTGIKYWNRDLIGGGASVTYDLCDTQPAGADRTVLVDNGVIIVKPLPGPIGVEVWTTKNVLFDGPISGTATVMFACLSGWADVGQDLILGCAGKKKGQTGWGATSVTSAGSGGGSGGGSGPASGAKAKPRSISTTPGGVGAVGSGVVVDTVDWLTTCIDDLSTKVGACAAKAAAGDLTANDLARSGSEVATRAMLDPLKLAEIAARARRMPAPTRPGPRPPFNEERPTP